MSVKCISFNPLYLNPFIQKKMGVAGVYVHMYFSYFLTKHRLWVRVRTASARRL